MGLCPFRTYTKKSMKKPTIEKNRSHLIVKCLDSKIDIQDLQNWLDSEKLGFTIHLASYEIGKHKDRHLHCYTTSLYTKRYYASHLKHPLYKFRLKFIKDDIEDRKRVVRYIFKDGDDYYQYSKTKFLLDYRENKDCSLHDMNLYDIYCYVKERREAGLPPTPSQTEYWISHFKELNPKPTKKEILKEIINHKKQKSQEITKLRIKNLLQTILVNIDPSYEKYLIEEIADEI